MNDITNRARPDLYRVAGLLAACPVTGDNPPHCPLAQVRNLPGQKLTEWLFALTHQQIVAIERAHAECYKKCQTGMIRQDRSDRTIEI